VPFLDHELVELCAGIPSSLKLRGIREKYVLRRALEGVLPPDIQWRPKRPLAAPVEGWLRDPLPDFAEDLLSPARVRATGYFEPAGVERLLTQVRAGQAPDARVLLMVMGVQLWDALFRARPPAIIPETPRRVDAGSSRPGR
jgi:asparagine synthase (glutamine-hydrolysing)